MPRGVAQRHTAHMHRHKGYMGWSGGSSLETPITQETRASLGMVESGWGVNHNLAES